jgi:hypothetical protein
MTSPLPGVLRAGWRSLPHPLRKGLADIVGRAGLKVPLAAVPRLAAEAELRPGPLVVSGFLSDDRGVAQGARLTVAGLRAAGLRPVPHDVTYLIDQRGEPISPRTSGGVWLLHCNAPEALAVLRRHLELSCVPAYRIGYWVWELPHAPPEWIEVAAHFHEIWTPSEFASRALGQSPTPVRTMPHPVPSSPLASPVPIGRVRFTSFADLRSASARKNPGGAAEAFLRAFPEPGPASLTVKLSGAESDPAACERLRALQTQRPDVELIVGRLDDAAMLALMERTDVVVSLHRAEGFGLPLAEAMAAGRAVVATGWSGNLEFMRGPAADQLVPFHLTPVADPSGRYGAAQDWAEPDVEAAAALMRRMADDADWRLRLGLANRAAIAALHEPWSAERLRALPMARHLEVMA